jgi:hypothetical protein
MIKRRLKDKNQIKLSLLTWLGILIIVFLIISYFIKINVDSGDNYVTQDSLLGIAIFHNPFILGLYILTAFALITSGSKINGKK